MSNDLTQMTQRSLDEQVIGNLNRLQEQGLECRQAIAHRML